MNIYEAHAEAQKITLGDYAEAWKLPKAFLEGAIAELLFQAVGHARAEEREACAQLAEQQATWFEADSYAAQTDMQMRIAAAIRARGDQ